MKNVKTYENYSGRYMTFKEFLNDEDVNLNIIEMSCVDKNLIDLDGIDIFKNLKQLTCPDNHISNLKDIITLTNLVDLNLSRNLLKSLEGIENLTKLTSIGLGDNDITSLKGIENLTKLEELFCWKNPIDWVDYIDKQGRTYYIKLPKSMKILDSDKFGSIDQYWEFMDENQPSGISRKFNF